MKKQIILISRINYGSSEEFLKYTDDKSKISVLHKTDEFKLLIIKGSSFYKHKIPSKTDNYNQKIEEFKQQESVRILETALAESLDKDAETIIAYHDRDPHLTDLNFAIKTIGIKVNVIQKYSGTDDFLYEQIIDPLGESLISKRDADLPELIEKLWDFFCLDLELEEKLKLLDRIRSGEAGKEDNLDKRIDIFQKDFSDFIQSHSDFFSSIKDEKEKAFNEYKLAYDMLYDKLGLED